MKDRKKLIILMIASVVLMLAVLPVLTACGTERHGRADPQGGHHHADDRRGRRKRRSHGGRQPGCHQVYQR